MKRRFFSLLLILALLLSGSGVNALAEAVLTLPAGLQIISENAFYGSSAIERVVLPGNVKEIRAQAFANSSLTKINLPDSLIYIDPTAFDGPEKVSVTANPGSYAYEWAVNNGYISLAPAAPLMNTPIVFGNSVVISWNSDSSVENYTLFYGTSSSLSQAIAVSAGTQNSYTLNNLSYNTTYYFWVKATGVGGTSEASPRKSARTGATVPAAPAVNSPIVSGNTITITWSRVSEATAYTVYYGTSSSFEQAEELDVGNTTTKSITDLAYNTTYYLWVTASNSMGESAAASYKTGKTGAAPAVLPSVPVVNTPIASENSISVSWSRANGATDYIVYYGTDTDIDAAESVYTDGETSCILRNLAYNTTYYIWVKAENNIGRSAESARKSAKTGAEPNPVPTAPAQNTPVAAGNSITLSWNAVSGALGYTIFYGTTSNIQNAISVSVGSATSKKVSGLEYNTTYYTWVKAFNSTGTSAASAMKSVKTGLALPGAPIQNAPLASGNSITVSWNAVSGATGYTIFYGTSTNISNALSLSASGTSKTISGLQYNTTYYLWVKASNSAGMGEASDMMSIATAPQEPVITLEAPSNFKFDAATNSAVSVSFHAVSGATGYYVYYSTSSVFSASHAKVATSSSVGYVDGLSSGTKYYFWVAPYDANGKIGAVSSRISAITGAVSGLTLNNPDTGAVYSNKGVYDFNKSNSLNLSFSATNGNGEFEVKAFIMNKQPAFDSTDIHNAVSFLYGTQTSTDVWTKEMLSSWSGRLPFGFSNYSTGQYVKIWVAARDKNYSDNRITSGIQFALKLTATAPANVKTSQAGIDFIKSWESCKLYVYDDGAGNPTIGWGHKILSGESFTTITQEEADALFLQDLARKEATTNSFISKTGITPTQQQYDALSSFFYNGNGGALSSDTNFYRMFANNKANLSGISPQEVYRRFAAFCNPGTNVQTGLFKRRCDEARIFLDGVYARRAWTIPAWVRNGQSVDESWYPAELGSTPDPIPNAPVQNTPTASGNSITLSWSSVNGATGYTVYYGTSSSISNAVSVSAGNGTSKTITGLQYNTTYYTWVKASNASGTSSASSVKSVKTGTAPTTKLPAPTNLAFTGITTDAITLSFNSVSGAAGYYVYYSTSSTFSSSHSKTEATASGGFVGSLTANTTYYFWVAAYDANGTIGYESARLSTTTGSVTNMTLKNQATGVLFANAAITEYNKNTKLNLSFTASNSNGEFEVKAFTMNQKPAFNSEDINHAVSFLYGTKDSNDVWTADMLANWNGALPFDFSSCTSGQYVKIWVGARDKNFTVNKYKTGIQFALQLTGGTVTIPSAPTQNALTASGNTITVSWSSVSGATGYTVYYGTSSLASNATAVSAGSGTSYTLTGLKYDTKYYIWVTASNSAGESSKSSRKYITTEEEEVIVTVPAAPVQKTPTASGNSITVSWSSVSGATSYTVYYGTSSYLSNATAVHAGSGASKTLTGLKYGTKYYIWVTASNSAGESDESDREYIYTEEEITSKLAAPTGLEITGVTTDAVSVSFNSVSGAAGYYFYYSTSSTFSTSLSKGTTNKSDLTGYVNGLTSGKTYYFWVAAYDASGNIGYESSRVSTIVASATLKLTNRDTGKVYADQGTYEIGLNEALYLAWSATNGNGTIEVKSFVMSRETQFNSSDANYASSYFYGDSSYASTFTASSLSQWNGAIPFGFSNCSAGQYVKIWVGARDKNYSTNGYRASVQFALKLTSGGGSFPSNLYVSQNTSTTCTLASAAMMLRARAYLSGYSNWSSLTESGIKSTAWLNGTGLYHNWTYSFSGNKITVGHANDSSMTVSKLKSLLNSHPEGIVLYCYDSANQHAVFVTDYVGDTFYCADPAGSYAGSRITLDSSLLGARYGSQANILAKAKAYWYVSSYSISN